MPEIPDLGAIGRPQQLQVGVSALVAHAPNLPPELLDGQRLTDLFRLVMREELERIMLISASDGAVGE